MLKDKFKTYYRNKRMVWYDEFAEQDDELGFYGYQQQMVADVAQSLGLSYTQAFTIWCAVDDDVLEGDEIENEDTLETFYVKAIKHLLDSKNNSHKQLFVEKQIKQYE